MSDALTLGIGFLKGFTSSSLFLLALFIGFCVIIGFTKLKRTAGGTARVVKSLDERLSKQPMVYLLPTAPRGPADPLEGFGTRRAGGT
jgi:acid phosphatase family membrane protein YuiD